MYRVIGILTLVVIALFISNVAFVSITVTAVGNDPPVADDDSASTFANTSVVIDVLANDTDTDNDTLAITDITAPANGNAGLTILPDLLQTFINPTPADDDIFGHSVSVSGDNVLVGAPLDNTGANDAGAAYLFNTTTGTLLQTFTSPIPANNDQFGGSVSLSGDKALVGAQFDNTGAINAGAAYLFNATTGTLLQTFTSPTPSTTDTFGGSVSVSGDNVLVGTGGDDTGANDAGAAYMFNATTGTLLQTFTNPTPADGDLFGFSVSVSGDKVLVGTPFDDTAASDSGAAYLLGERDAIEYTSNLSFSGLDSFSYTISDGRGGTDTATVTILVNSPPLANDDFVTTDFGTDILIDVLANDIDPDGDPLTIISVTAPLINIALVDETLT